MNTIEYPVKSGDTLSAIARRHGVPVDVLSRLNGLSDVNKIWAGQVLRIPQGQQSTPVQPPPPLTYRVRAGDTLSEIAEAQGVTVNAIVKENGLRDADDIKFGQVLRLPPRDETTAQTQSPNTQNPKNGTTTPKTGTGTATNTGTGTTTPKTGAGTTTNTGTGTTTPKTGAGTTTPKTGTGTTTNTGTGTTTPKTGTGTTTPKTGTGTTTPKTGTGTTTPSTGTGISAQVPQEVIRHIELREGKLEDHRKVYVDTRGYLTAGMGHKLTKSELARYDEGDTVPMDVLKTWARADTQKAYDAAVAQAREAGVGNQSLVNALTAVNFQLGTSWYTEHKQTWAYIKAHKWEEAADEAADSKWFKQTPVRVKDFQAALRAMTGAKIQPVTTQNPSGGNTSQQGPDLKAIVRNVHDAMDGAGTDEEAVYTNLAKLKHDKALIDQFKKLYKSTYRVDVVDDIKADFSNSYLQGNELDRALSYLTPKTGGGGSGGGTSPSTSTVGSNAGNKDTMAKLGKVARTRLKLKNTGACARGVSEMLGSVGYQYENYRPTVSAGIVSNKVYDYDSKQWINAATKGYYVPSHRFITNGTVKKQNEGNVRSAAANESAKYFRHTLKMLGFAECTAFLPGNGHQGGLAPKPSVTALRALPEGAVVVFGPALSRSVQRAAANKPYTVGGHGHAGHVGVLVREGNDVLVVADGLLDSSGGKYTVETCLSAYAWAIGYVPTSAPKKLTKKDLPASSL
jgi:LysM repeat protein